MVRNIVLAAVVLAFVGVGGYLILASRAPGAAGTERRYELTVANDKMSPSALQATEGDTLRITVNADREMEMHLHGYDRSFEVKPGQGVTQSFKADKTGSFEIEIESESKVLGTLEVRPR